jgi:glycolate oxidase iron-sulfur subunit
VEIHLHRKFSGQPWAEEAQEVVRKCVHCGFCNATCPTYQLLGDEADGPRGRIYLISQLLEGQSANSQTRKHLDRCLLCRACETTCPSGVKYSRLLDAGRRIIDEHGRSGIDGLKRSLLTSTIPYPGLMQMGIHAANSLRSLLPKGLTRQLPKPGKNLSWPKTVHERKVLLLEGCAQSSLTPETSAAAARLLDRLGIMPLGEPGAGCCGAVRLHTSATREGLQDARRRIDAWWPLVSSGIEAIISSASGCGVTVKEYGELLKSDERYAEKAARISELCVDLSELVLAELGCKEPAKQKQRLKIACQNPCSLQHGQKLHGTVEAILQHQGFQLVPVEDGHLCCGSAGTYSVLQPALARQLKDDKLAKLQAQSPDVIVTANIGCQLHLRTEAEVPVVHWVELLDNPTQNRIT